MPVVDPVMSVPVIEPLITDVELGINRVYGAHARGEIIGEKIKVKGT